ncbi:LOW QUALITY PROTEIN: pancreatic triacylglycerol lipase-like [Alosa alosa]|uniref:LOW QUALITY PROTEIN: pancreatic triacylglycerol lipase-like n=1 Tax=Alosa alosa TaxID=278164 RepID=UPI00201508FA|nr:LOW QUALITY PROTEIN: pancreatic triacylglycerol lipase-like [Alosa alosa]
MPDRPKVVCYPVCLKLISRLSAGTLTALLSTAPLTGPGVERQRQTVWALSALLPPSLTCLDVLPWRPLESKDMSCVTRLFLIRRLRRRTEMAYGSFKVKMLLPCLMTVLLGLLGPAHGEYEPSEVCYDRLGCFSDSLPGRHWAGTVERPEPRLPWSPEQIATRFLLYTPQNPEHYQEISAGREVLEVSNYSPSRKSRFIIHGYISKGNQNWPSDMCKLILQVEDVNCISVDWTVGGRSQYPQAANNIRVVGAQVADMMSVMKSSFQQSAGEMHVIGHSLGAHAAAEAGRRTKGLGRITGLDPAEPYFQGCPAQVRLDPATSADAKFVDVIHSDASPFGSTLGFGMSQTVGHVDFYPNGGEQMPGCPQNAAVENVDPNNIWEGTRFFVACNHQRSYQYYSDSILNRSGFTGYPCNDFSTFESGSCFPCSEGECPVMGHFADTFKIPDGVSKMRYFMSTGKSAPFVRYRYHVNVTIDGTRRNPGYFKVALYGASDNTRQYRIFIGFLKPGGSYDTFVDTERDVGEVTHVKFVWNNNIINPMLPRFGATRIQVLRGQDSRTFEFCRQEKVLENVLQTLSPCGSP